MRGRYSHTANKTQFRELGKVLHVGSLNSKGLLFYVISIFLNCLLHFLSHKASFLPSYMFRPPTADIVRVKVKGKGAHYRPGVAQRVPGS